MTQLLEKQLTNMCVNDMATNYEVLLKNSRLYAIFELHKAARRIRSSIPIKPSQGHGELTTIKDQHHMNLLEIPSPMLWYEVVKGIHHYLISGNNTTQTTTSGLSNDNMRQA